ncbi:MAG: CRISPR-associated protein [Selenomonadaceae bacterium]|nr:CRISPR-associated protein [Selenomonadaceae bacterium]
MFVNHTNHPSNKWSIEQIESAQAFGSIKDFLFPNISPHASAKEIDKLVAENLEFILTLKPAAVLCQGEFNYTFALVERLKNFGVTVLAATSERVVTTEILADGSSRQISTFRFVQFREY